MVNHEKNSNLRASFVMCKNRRGYINYPKTRKGPHSLRSFSLLGTFFTAPFFVLILLRISRIRIKIFYRHNILYARKIRKTTVRKGFLQKEIKKFFLCASTPRGGGTESGYAQKNEKTGICCANLCKKHNDSTKDHAPPPLS